ncbi:hypothetical protein [Flavobacterium columnare]|uniref:hypothetical protein n=1 Tax=Flavobacterium columnare TaxID=996 RepID=UPI0007F9BBE2|nr:hypothetical protein [Flavobacterium columnare]ANO48699.1 hypothetical protein Pf1_00451 [Flavobacterium columnare]
MDDKATAFISFAGIVYLIVWITGLIVELTILTPEDKTALLNRMFGKYWVAFWTQPLLWVFLTQLLRFPIVQKNVLSH